MLLSSSFKKWTKSFASKWLIQYLRLFDKNTIYEQWAKILQKVQYWKAIKSGNRNWTYVIQDTSNLTCNNLYTHFVLDFIFIINLLWCCAWRPKCRITLRNSTYRWKRVWEENCSGTTPTALVLHIASEYRQITNTRRVAVLILYFDEFCSSYINSTSCLGF